MRNPNGYGSVIKLAGNRRKPWACRLTVGFRLNEATQKANPIYKYISYHATRKEAVKALAEYNNFPYDINSLTFSDIFDKWQNTQPDNKQIRRRNKNAFSKISSLHNKKFSTLRLGDLQSCFDAIELTQSNINAVKIVLKGMYSYAVKHNIAPMSTLEMIKLITIIPKQKTKTVDRKAFTRNEIDYLWSKSDDSVVKQILVYIYTGMRFEELHSVSDECVHDNYIEITKAKTEAGKRIVPLSDKVLSLVPIDRIPTYSTFYVQFMKIMSDGNMKHTIHDCRHTFISLMTEAGVDARLIKKIVGHSRGDVTEDVYTHISLEAMLEAVNRI